MGGDPRPGPHDLDREAFEKDPGVFMRVLRALKPKKPTIEEIAAQAYEETEGEWLKRERCARGRR